ncbi:MAG: ABC transporter ATP-binding protein [Gemmatimonadota bacterium]
MSSSEASPAAVRCRGLVKRYGEVLAVDGLDLDVSVGECFGLLGPNGAGKTTTVEVLEGLLEPDAGDIRILGKGWGEDERSLRRSIGIQLQETRLPEKLTVAETVRLFRSFYAEGATVDEVIERVQLQEKRDTWVRRLSGGQQQRLAVACALVGAPRILFLDEPTTGLDPQSRRSMWDLVEDFRAAGGTIVLTTHYMEEAARLCDRLAIIDHGRVIAQGTPRELVDSLGADQVVEFTVAAGSAPPEAELAALPGVSRVLGDGERWALTVRGVHVTVPALLSRLERDGTPLTSLATHDATLEDVFVHLTGRSLRDE